MGLNYDLRPTFESTIHPHNHLNVPFPRSEAKIPQLLQLVETLDVQDGLWGQAEVHVTLACTQ